MLQNWIGSMEMYAKNFETQRLEGVETRRHEDAKAQRFLLNKDANKWKMLLTLKLLNQRSGLNLILFTPKFKRKSLYIQGEITFLLSPFFIFFVIKKI
jgi:hypothetical protein